MDLSDQEIESTLRQAPAPQPPPSLEGKLVASFRDNARNDLRNHRPVTRRPAESPWRRWLPIALPLLATAALSGVVGVQQAEVVALQREIRELREQLSPPLHATLLPAGNLSQGTPLPDERQEIVRLREWAKQLEQEVGHLEQIHSENEQLRAAFATQQRQAAQDNGSDDGQLAKAQAVQCSNNLKQFGLAARIYATDNNDEFPPDTQSLSNELVTPMVLVCPSDTTRAPAPNFASFNVSHMTYEFLAPGPGAHETDPTRVLARCPIHGHIGLCDGSVIRDVGIKHPEWLTWRNGVLYFTGDVQSGPVVSGNGEAPPPAGMSDELRRRYGLGPGGDTGAPVVTHETRFDMSPELMKRYGLVPAPVVDSEEATNVIVTDEPAPQP